MIDHFIAGREQGRAPQRVGEVYDPSTGQVRAQVAFASPEDVDAAVGAALGAFSEWRHESLSQRTRIMFAFRELVERRKQDLARVISSEHGKVLADAVGEVSRGQEVIEFACGIAHLSKGGFSENVSSKVDSYSIRQPLGVIAGITPFNFPAMVPMWMYPVAIACGNSFVLKPSEKDPSAANFVAELWQEAGLPDGVFNVVHGDKVAVDRLLQHRDVAAVSSVGSTPVARYIYETAARNGKRVQALGGAKNHMIVLPDADMEAAADAAVSAGYGSSGQRCMAISTIVAVGEAGDALVEKIADRLAGLRIGPATDPVAEMGPLVTGEHRDKVASFIEAGERQGAKLIVDGREASVEGHERGFFLGPCLFDRVTTDMSIYTEEIFGPVLVVLRADAYDDAIAIVNSNRYGNGTAVFTNDGGAARKFVNEVEVGMVGINVPIPVPMAFYSFGGWKDSLFGDLHIHGPEGVAFYTRGKVVTSRWSDPEARGVDLGFPANR
ncbi:MAG TPA: CoA-acylating methylmalonate-semialdehyde dehydrogenase [Actinomycetota bacterium]|nr:CoA-acylating methylmalonate-semialdehyde dehydrogenase [Actinomycetota bacterium]